MLNPTLAEAYDRAVLEVPKTLGQLADLVRDQPDQVSRANQLAHKVAQFVAEHSDVVRLARAGNSQQALERLQALPHRFHAAEIRKDLTAFVAAAKDQDDERQQDLAVSRRRLNGLLVLATVLSLVLTASVALVFSRRISGRLATLMDNSARLALGQALAAPSTGSDEIAQLDRVFHAMARELTASQQALRASAEEVRDLYNNAPCGYHSVNPSGILIAINDTELRWLGRQRYDILGKMKFHDFLTPPSRITYRQGFVQFLQCGAVYDVELEILRPDGTVLPILLNASAIRDPGGKIVASRSTLFDITERKRAEAAVRQFNVDLEQQIVERTRELVEANRELALKNQENEMFVYSVSHDLRSPLVNLEGFSNELDLVCQDIRTLVHGGDVPAALRDQVIALMERDMGEAIHFIRSAVRRLSTIIDALLRLSRAGRIEYAVGEVDVAAAVASIVAAMHATVEQRGATVLVEELPAVRGDATAIEQVFANLIGNALNYLDPARPGIIEVGCRAVDPEDGMGFRTFYVKDNGLGIPQGRYDKIFLAFKRLHPDVARGEGMGLAIVRRIVERHRGKVWVESQLGVGSTFLVTLPVVATTEPQAALCPSHAGGTTAGGTNHGP
jgi:PAS domain S-box-containing protein